MLPLFINHVCDVLVFIGIMKSEVIVRCTYLSETVVLVLESGLKHLHLCNEVCGIFVFDYVKRNTYQHTTYVMKCICDVDFFSYWVLVDLWLFFIKKYVTLHVFLNLFMVYTWLHCLRSILACPPLVIKLQVLSMPPKYLT